MTNRPATPYNLDQVSVLGRTLSVIGWAKDHQLGLSLDGADIPFLADRETRPDVAAAYPDEPDALHWGFAMTALLPAAPLDRTRLAIRVRPDIVLIDPARMLYAAEDIPAIRLIEGFLETVRRTKGSVLELGSRARSGNSYRSLFPADIDYVGCDITSGPNVDIVADVHELSAAIAQKFDYIFSISVFEHLLMPWKVAIEMAKVLKVGGLAYIQSHSAYPLHDEPWDFWRYSRDSWRGIFNAHTGFEVVDAQYRYPARVVPQYIGEAGHEHVSASVNHLVSACLVRKIGPPRVEWAARAADVYDLAYSHGMR